MRILLVEDDENLTRWLAEALTNQHHTVDEASDGQAGWELAESLEYDLILLDVMLPQLDGISFCQRLRQRGDRTPVLLLTAQDASTMKVMGLDAGADDYVVKPCDLQELLARVRALLRRGNDALPPLMEWGSLCLNPSNCEVTYAEQPLHLTAKEYALLELFLRNPQRLFCQRALLEHLWSFAEPPSENAVRTHIKSLRRKLKEAGAVADFIETVYGLGYRLKAKESLAVAGEPEPKSLPSPSSSSLSSKLMTIWERGKESYLNRIALLQEAAQAWQHGNLSEALLKQAIEEAHTLVGSLGTFGFDEASEKSRQIEEIFRAGSQLTPAQATQLANLIVQLRRDLEQGHPAALTHEAPAERATDRPSPVPRLLVVDDDTALVRGLLAEAETWGMVVEGVTCPTEARRAIARSRPDVVLLDLGFPDSTEQGFALLAELTAAEPPIPTIISTARESLADRVKVARFGGRGFLQKPVAFDVVRNAIAQVLQKSVPPLAKLLIVDDDPQVLDLLRVLLEPRGFQLTLLDRPQSFWQTLEQSAPDLLLLDVEMPGWNGIDLCSVVRNDPRWHALPIVFLSARTDAQTARQAFAAGADDFVNKPISNSELVTRILNRLERTRRRQLR